MILVIDNYDSFVHNLARYFQRLGQPTLVVRNDAVDCAGVERLEPRALVLSPGPCTPAEAGICLELVRTFAGRLPILGVCLGHQTIAAAWGAPVARSPEPMHGRSSLVYHNRDTLFDRIPSPFRAGRYHSLIVPADAMPSALAVTAWTQDGLVMGLRHRELPIWGVQFHPESVMTECGYRLLANFLVAVGIELSVASDELFGDELAVRPESIPKAGALTPIPY
ncbi:MAG: glutamine amidotransferase [Pirellulaceae bacterium]|nr:MAG: glutamine amidotransferase [Pirellulaceae bacterium]